MILPAGGGGRGTWVQGNSEFFLAPLLPATIGYTPTLPRCGRPGRGSSWGDGSADQMPHLAALALAERLGITPARFPGGSPGLHNPPRAVRRNHRLLAG